MQVQCTIPPTTISVHIFTVYFLFFHWYAIIYRYNGGEGFVPGSMFCKFDRRQSSGYVKNVSLPYIHRMNIHLALLYVVHVQCTIIHNYCDVLDSKKVS